MPRWPAAYTWHVLSTTQKPWTDADLLALPDDGRYELVDSELVRMSPAGGQHGDVVAELLARVRVFVTEHKLGPVFDGQTGFRLPDGNLRSPDVSFVSAARLPGGVPVGFLHVPPDLAMEVLSPSDRAADVARKVAEYLNVGVELFRVIDPGQRAAVVYRPGTAPYRPENDILDGEAVLPGFACPLTALFG